MAVSAVVNLETSQGTIWKLANGNYRLRKSSPCLQTLYDERNDVFTFCVDHGFLITSYGWLERNGKQTRKIKLNHIEQPKNPTLVEVMEMKRTLPSFRVGTMFSLIVELEVYNPQKNNNG